MKLGERALVGTSLKQFFERLDDLKVESLSRENQSLLADLYYVLGSIVEEDKSVEACKLYVIKIIIIFFNLIFSEISISNLVDINEHWNLIFIIRKLNADY